METTESKPCTDVATIGKNGRLTIPACIREAAGLAPGDVFDVTVVPEGLLLSRHCEGVEVVDDEYMASFWGPDWKAEMYEAMARHERGDRKVSMSLEEFFADLDAIPPADDADL